MATSVLIPTAAHRGARSARLALPAATVLPDADRRFEVRLGDAAVAQTRAGIASARRRLGPDPETGGVLFGERDDAAGVIWIDEATGPPRDSVESPGLPQLQSASFGTTGLGYGDFFAAAVLGGILAAERGPQLAAAIGMVVVSLCWDQLFFVYDVLPATIPPAVVLAATSLWRARSSPAPPGLSSDRFPRSGGRMMPQPSDEPPERRLVHAGR